MTDELPLLIEFAAGTRVERAAETTSQLRILRNGPPGTFVIFRDGSRVSLPTDQIVFTDDSGGSARVGFGGMSFAGVERGELVFHRVRDLAPAETLSPQRGTRMTLDPEMVSSISTHGRRVWPLLH